VDPVDSDPNLNPDPDPVDSDPNLNPDPEHWIGGSNIGKKQSLPILSLSFPSLQVRTRISTRSGLTFPFCEI
jgi:hypothetical protein